MPIAVIKSWSKKYKVPKKELEAKWKDAEKAAEKQGQKNNYRYQMGIFKNMTKADRNEDLQNFRISEQEFYMKDEIQKLRDFVMENIDIDEGVGDALTSIAASPFKAVGAVGKAAGRVVAAPLNTVRAGLKTVGKTGGELLRGRVRSAGAEAVGGLKKTAGAALKPVTGAVKDVSNIAASPFDALAK